SSVPLVPPMLGQAFIRQAVSQVFEQGRLEHYQAIREMPGFISALQARFAELKRGLVYPDVFTAFAQDQPKPVQELARIYEAYQNLLIEHNWADPEGLSWLAVEFMEAHPDWQPDWPLIVLDGFDSFTKPQIKALTLLAERVPEIVITLPGSLEMSRSAHQRFSETFGELRDLPGVEHRSLDTSLHLPPTLAHLEVGLGETAVEQKPTQGQVDFIEARSPAEEAREALRWLKSRIVRDGFPIQNCALIVADPSTYRAHLRAVADEFGMPIEFSAQPRLNETPLFVAFNTLLSLTTNDFQRRLVLDVIRSPYFDLSVYGLSHQDANALDMVSRAQQVVGGRAIWLESLESLRQVEEGIKMVSDEDFSAPQLPSGETAFRIGNALEQFFDRIMPLTEEQSLVEWVTWLEDLLADLDFWQKTDIDADLDAQATLRQLLRELVLAETVAGLQIHSYRSFLDVLGEGAGQTQVVLSNRTRTQKIKVLRLVEGRGLRHDAVAVLGLSEGIFPRPQKEDPFLTEAIREQLGLESAFDRHQLGLFYQAVTRADRRLLLTRPFLSPEGEPWEASPFWEDARRLFTDDMQKVTGEGYRSLSEAGSPPEILAWATYQGSIKGEVRGRLAERVRQVLHGREVLENRLSDAPNPYNGSLPGEEDLVGEETVFSASRLESYLSCPHWYFAAHQLGLEAQQNPVLGMNIAQRGSIMHEILERVYGEADDPTDLDALLERLDQV
ncbi:MAG TPA: PD-(D/E)XK nuclease family protein, partial [Anaerolineales bacterium]|nr:PD-(D/E)XK nuclease family protein [Anaerolineales bacterium]